MLALEKPGCKNCVGACCQDMILPLNPQEVRKLRRGGTTFTYLGKPSTGRDVRGYYKMEGKCGFLKEGKCAIHASPARPLVCGSFPEGGYGCMERRAAFFTEKPIAVATEK